MIDFSNSVSSVKAKFKKDQLKTCDSIMAYQQVDLASMGSNDTEGYQFFTPRFIVEQMTDAIGEDCLNFSKTILEPTSGDGAFTTYILSKRLDTINGCAEIESLRALSTIYSIEMDKRLVQKQRNNIFTVLCNWAKERKLEADSSFFDIAKCIITTNFIWAMFNSDIPIGGLFTEVAFKMPEAEKKNYKSLDFPVWEITEEAVAFHYEGVETW